MNVVRLNPWRELDRVGSSWLPPVEIWETAAAYRIDLELPAVAREDVAVSLADGILEISGERKRAEPAEDRRDHRLERRYGRFSRRFKLPETADVGSIVARLADGVLEVSIAKQALAQPRRIEVVAA